MSNKYIKLINNKYCTNLKNEKKIVFSINKNIVQQVCFAQDGEDLVLDRLLDGKLDGFYIDIGAHHPSRFSNTFLFYQRGWSGLNIDAQPKSMELFNLCRPRDINIECGVGLQEKNESFFQFNEPALNTFNSEEARIKDHHPYYIESITTVKIRRLDDILLENLKNGQKIDFMSVDVEGFDLEVLMSNNWQRVRPKFVLAETLRTPLVFIQNCPIVKYMDSVWYDVICKVYNTAFFERR
ncbi:MAG: FkbM family methyltransferase, partial [bacterium]|nr:FkbM family methyltransferase [bacterium]